MTTGVLEFNEKKYRFELEKFVLDIYPENQGVSFEEIDSFFNGNIEKLPQYVEGEISENSNKIVFLIQSTLKNSLSGTCQFNLDGYLIFDGFHSTEFESVSYSSKELDSFYEMRNAINDLSIDHKTGKINFSLKPFNETNHTWEFITKDKQYDVNLNISRRFSGNSRTPLSLETEMRFDKGQKMSVSELNEVTNVFIAFQNFISYRQNTSTRSIVLKKKNKNDKFIRIGEYFINRRISSYVENEKTITQRIIKYRHLSGKMGNIFNYIAEDRLYLRHYPKDSADLGTVTVARLILITAGFEWHFKQKFGDVGIQKEPKAKEIIMAYLNDMIKSKTGKEKKYLKYVTKVIDGLGLSLSDKISYALEYYEEYMAIYVYNLLKINGKNSYLISEISKDIQDTRNDFAHGNLDKDLKEEVVLGIIILEWLLYVIVLDENSVNLEEIKKIINELFARRIAI